MDSSTFISKISHSSILHSDYIDFVVCKLRRDIYEFLIRRKFDCEDQPEDEYNEEFDLTKYLRIINFEHMKVVISEIEHSGWKTSLAYGDTCLFIYVGEQPVRCR